MNLNYSGAESTEESYIFFLSSVSSVPLRFFLWG